MWPLDADSLVAVQRDLGATSPEPWEGPAGRCVVGGCWVCFPRGITGRGGAGDPAWAAAVATVGDDLLDRRVLSGAATAPYEPGLLALRVGPLLERVVRSLTPLPDVLLLDASGRDHPRRAGLAVHLGAVLGVPTVGVTHRPLLAEGTSPPDRRGATGPLRIDDDLVAAWVRTRSGTRPLVVHAGWRTSLATAVEVVTVTTRRARTPEPLRRARQLAREARAAAG